MCIISYYLKKGNMSGFISRGGGSFQLIQDVLAGPGTGSQSATVAGIQSHPVNNANPTTGDALVWNGTEWAPTTVGGGGWSDAVLLDFKSLPNQVISSDGDVSVGDISCTKLCSSNESVPMEIIPDVGLVVQPANGSDYTGGTYAWPQLFIKLIDLIPDFNLGMSLRITLGISSFNGTQSYDNALLAVTSGNCGHGWTAKRGYNPGGVGVTTMLVSNYNNIWSTHQNLTLDSTNNVIVLDIPALYGTTAISGVGAITDGSLPNLNTIIPTGCGTTTSVTSNALATNMGVAIGGLRGSPGTTGLSIIFDSILIQYKK